jgi:hypothetical protein
VFGPRLLLGTGNTLGTMSFDTTARVSLNLDQLLQLVDQLSDADTKKVLARLELNRKRSALARMRKTFRKVKLTPGEVTKLVEQVREERHARSHRH